MRFISKLYFNIFKRNGNLRLLLVIGALFAGISLFWIIKQSVDSVYYYTINSDTLNPKWVPPYKMKSEDRDKITDLQKLLPLIEICIKKDSKAALEFINYSYTSVYNTKVYPNGFGKTEKFEDIDRFCKIVKVNGNIKFNVWSFSYLWNLLWVVFWFYLPFMVAAPIKFVVDGYQKDKLGNKKDKK